MRGRGFTLVEMLVTLGVIGVLLGLLLPMLSGIVRAGRGTRCASNLRQMAYAAHQYANLYDRWPVAIRYQLTDGVLHQVAWDWVTTVGLEPELVSPGALWMLSDDPNEVMQCPEYLGATNFTADPFTGYNYNTSYLGGEAPFGATTWDAVRHGVRPSACRRSSQCAMFGDGGRFGGTNKFMRAPLNHESMSLDLIYSGGQAYRHQGATHAVHVDCHVGAAQNPRAGELATDQLLAQHMGFPENGFLSDDDDAYDPR